MEFKKFVEGAINRLVEDDSETGKKVWTTHSLEEKIAKTFQDTYNEDIYPQVNQIAKYIPQPSNDYEIGVEGKNENFVGTVTFENGICLNEMTFKYLQELPFYHSQPGIRNTIQVQLLTKDKTSYSKNIETFLSSCEVLKINDQVGTIVVNKDTKAPIYIKALQLGWGSQDTVLNTKNRIATIVLTIKAFMEQDDSLKNIMSARNSRALYKHFRKLAQQGNASNVWELIPNISEESWNLFYDDPDLTTKYYDSTLMNKLKQFRKDLTADLRTVRNYNSSEEIITELRAQGLSDIQICLKILDIVNDMAPIHPYRVVQITKANGDTKIIDTTNSKKILKSTNFADKVSASHGSYFPLYKDANMAKKFLSAFIREGKDDIKQSFLNYNIVLSAIQQATPSYEFQECAMQLRIEFTANGLAWPKEDTIKFFTNNQANTPRIDSDSNVRLRNYILSLTKELASDEDVYARCFGQDLGDYEIIDTVDLNDPSKFKGKNND